MLLSLAPIVRVSQLGVTARSRATRAAPPRACAANAWRRGWSSGQMALAIVLLAGAGVLVRSFIAIVGADTGVRDARARSSSARCACRPDSTRIAADPARVFRSGRGAAAHRSRRSTPRPVQHAARRQRRNASGRSRSRAGQPAGGRRPVAVPDSRVRVISGGRRCGRCRPSLHDRRSRSRVPVAVVNESFAARYWPGESPIGRRLRTTAQHPRRLAHRGRRGAEHPAGRRLRQRVQAAGLRAVRPGAGAGASGVLSSLRTTGPAGAMRRPFELEVESIDPDVGARAPRHSRSRLRVRPRLHGRRTQRVGQAREGGAGLRRDCAAAGGGRARRGDRAFGAASGPGNRRPDRDRRRGARYPPDDRPRGHAAGRARAGRGPRSCRWPSIASCSPSWSACRRTTR